MRGGRLVVVDWTRSAARVGVFDENLRRWQLASELNLPARLVIRNEQSDGLRVLAGDEAAGAREDASALVFEQPVRDLPRMEEVELQTLLLSGFWRALGESLVAGGQLRAGRQAARDVVGAQRFSLPGVANLRAMCAG